MKHRKIWTAVLCGAAGIACAAMAAAKDQTQPLVPGVAVEFRTTVIATHVVPEGSPMPGLHLEMKVKGRTLDVYIAPMDFVRTYDVKVSKGEEALVEGTQDGDQVIARSITTGRIGIDGAFRPNMTIYLRNDAGPLW